MHEKDEALATSIISSIREKIELFFKGAVTNNDDKRSLVKGIILGKNYLKIKLEDYNLKVGETDKMTINGLKDELYMNFKYAAL